MSPVARYLIQTNCKDEKEEAEGRGQISAYFKHHVFVVLGEPGIGKTTLFRDAANTELDAEFLSVGEFLANEDHQHLKGKVLYLDGLDEQRSRIGRGNVIELIIARLKKLDFPKTRISCRTADWHTDVDLDALSVVSPSTHIILLQLQPIDKSDFSSIIPDPEIESFIEGAMENELDDFLHNPQDFILLHEFYKENGCWPSSRSELMEGACRVLLRGVNKAHSTDVDDQVSDKDLSHASDYLAAIMMLSNVVGISRKRESASKLFPSIHEFDGDLLHMKAAIGRGLFRQVKGQRIELKHRKIAEYLAARCLAHCVRNGLSLERVMALMTAADGGTASDLRGVYAWLITMLSGLADHLLKHDPYGAVIYGDTYAWTPNTKITAFKALLALSEKEPWFREEDRTRSALGGLSDPVLLKEFKLLLREDKCQNHLLSVVLDVIAAGGELLEVGDPLLDFIRNQGKSVYLRRHAIDGFYAACPKRLDDLLGLLEGVQRDDIVDEDQQIRGALLRILYPSIVVPADVGKYLVKPADGVISNYYMFLYHDLFEVTKPDGISALFEQYKNGEIKFGTDNDYDDNRFISKLIRVLITNHSGEAKPEEIISWLEVGLDEHGQNRMLHDEAKTIRLFLSGDGIYFSLFSAFLERVWREKEVNEWSEIWRDFFQLTINIKPPQSFKESLLHEIQKTPDTKRAGVMFEILCLLVMHGEQHDSAVTIDDLIVCKKFNANLKQIYERNTSCSIPVWRIESALRRNSQDCEMRSIREKNFRRVSEKKEDISSGKEIDILADYALVWFDRFYRLDHDLDPENRLKQELGHELAQVVKEGFINSIHSPPDNIIELALVYEIYINYKDDPKWKAWLILEHPGLYRDVLEKVWRTELKYKPNSISRFYRYSGDELELPAVIEILPNLLLSFPYITPTLLEVMLSNALQFCAIDDLLPIIDAALEKRYKKGTGQRVMWLAAGFAISPNHYIEPLKAQLKKEKGDRWFAYPLLMIDVFDRDKDRAGVSSLRYKSYVLEVLGGVFENVSFQSSVGVRSGGWHEEVDVAHRLRRLIHSYVEDVTTKEITKEAAGILACLEKNRELKQWRSQIKHTIASHVRSARKSFFTYPDVSKVVSTLANAEPASPADLRALVFDALREIAEEIRHGNTDDYKLFWNTDHRGRPTPDHVDENTARDRLLQLLRPKLKHLDIIAEPEARYAEDTRADIAIYSRSMKLPIEIKRDDHRNIWTALENQLEKQYTRDPSSEGNGIYLVFWFDGDDMANPKPRPSMYKKPKNARDLASALHFTLPEPSSGLIDIVVIDASVPEGKKPAARKKITKRKVTKKKASKKKATKKKASKKSARKY